MSKPLGKQFFIENKPGAAAQLGTLSQNRSRRLHAALDRHRRSVSSTGSEDRAYTIPNDFAFIGASAQQPYAFSINPNGRSNPLQSSSPTQNQSRKTEPRQRRRRPAWFWR